MGGSLLNDAVNSLRLFAPAESPGNRSLRTNNSRVGAPDVAWVNAMNEGILVGKKLLDAGIPHLHVSVHDDPAGLAIKSRRYRHLASLMDRRNSELLRQAHSVDVVCDSMRDYYRRRIGVNAGVVYRYIHNVQPPPTGGGQDSDQKIVYVGHVGAIYSAPEVFAFVRALHSMATSEGIQFRLTNFGRVSPMTARLKDEFPDLSKTPAIFAKKR